MNEYLMLMNIGSCIENASTIRKETLDGVEYIVCPARVMNEGVWSGTQGPIYYGKDDLKKSTESWNGRPVVVYHPKLRGKGVGTANTPSVAQKQKIGLVYNSKWENGLKMELWIDPKKADLVDKRIMEKINNSEKIEVSTGMNADVVKEEGTFNNRPYKYRAVNIISDHIAALPDETGAFSIKDGGGILANQSGDEADPLIEIRNRMIENSVKGCGLVLIENELSFSSVSGALTEALATKYGEKGKPWRGWIREIYKNWVVFSENSQLYLTEYSATETSVTLKGERKPAVVNVSYTTEDGTKLIANEANDLLPQKEAPKMPTTTFDVAAHITTLIGNGYEESDRPALEELGKNNPTFLAKLTPKKEAPPAPAVTLPVQNAQPKQQTLQDYLDKAPPEIQAFLVTSINQRVRHRNTLIQNIKTSEEAKHIPDTVFANMEDTVLETMSAMATKKATATIQNHEVLPFGGNGMLPVNRFSYNGVQGGQEFIGNNNAGFDNEPLPEVDFTPHKKSR